MEGKVGFPHQVLLVVRAKNLLDVTGLTYKTGMSICFRNHNSICPMRYCK